MRVEVNGQAREVSAGLTVLALLEGLGLRPMGTVVERNGQIVDRAAFEVTTLCDGDRLELVRIVGGG
jgi:sulfur carrier protein